MPRLTKSFAPRWLTFVSRLDDLIMICNKISTSILILFTTHLQLCNIQDAHVRMERKFESLLYSPSMNFAFQPVVSFAKDMMKCKKCAGCSGNGRWCEDAFRLFGVDTSNSASFFVYNLSNEVDFSILPSEYLVLTATKVNKSSSPRGSFHANGAQNAARASLKQRKQRGKLLRATQFVVRPLFAWLTLLSFTTL